MSIRTTLSADGSVCNIKITGAFDVALSTHFEDTLSTIPISVDIIRINLKEMTSFDASFLSSVLLVREKYLSTIIELFNCSKNHARRFSMAGLDKLVRVRLGTDIHQEDQDQNQSDDADEGKG